MQNWVNEHPVQYNELCSKCAQRTATRFKVYGQPLQLLPSLARGRLDKRDIPVRATDNGNENLQKAFPECWLEAVACQARITKEALLEQLRADEERKEAVEAGPR